MSYLLLYAAVFVVVLVLYMRRQSRRHREHAAQLEVSKSTGMAEPQSLHPVVDPARCIGSGACVKACPEEALGIVNGRAVLTNAAACIGHGACLSACPVEGIQLVFGTERRGVDIPHISPDFETNVPGIYIAGELGGMGLIRKAAEQGRQAMDAIRQQLGKGKRSPDTYDVVIVGCGPAGLSAGLAAIQHGLRYKLLEQEASLGGAVFHYPRNKIAMTAPVELALIGKVKFGEVQKEELLDFWNNTVKQTGLKISFREQLAGIAPQDSGFVVQTHSGHQYPTRTVLLTMGRRGTPRKLEVPGEEASKVVYRLIDAEQYRGQAVLVVGGGDSALEAAIALSRESGTRVTLSYRGDAFARVKAKNRELLEQQQQAGRVRVMLKSVVKSIETSSVHIEHEGKVHNLPNDAVIVCAGGQLPTELLQKVGIRFDTKFGTA